MLELKGQPHRPKYRSWQRPVFKQNILPPRAPPVELPRANGPSHLIKRVELPEDQDDRKQSVSPEQDRAVRVDKQIPELQADVEDVANGSEDNAADCELDEDRLPRPIRLEERTSARGTAVPLGEDGRAA